MSDGCPSPGDPHLAMEVNSTSDAPMMGVLLLRAKELTDQTAKARATLTCAQGQKPGLCD